MSINLYLDFINLQHSKSISMTVRQSSLKTLYPFWMWLNKLMERNRMMLENWKMPAPVPFYSLNAATVYGTHFDSSISPLSAQVINAIEGRQDES